MQKVGSLGRRRGVRARPGSSNWTLTFQQTFEEKYLLRRHLDLKGRNKVGLARDVRLGISALSLKAGTDHGRFARPTDPLVHAKICANRHVASPQFEPRRGERATEGALTAGQRRRRWGRRMERFGLPHIGDKWAHKRKRVFQGPRTHYATGKGSRGEGRMATFGDGLFRLLFGPHGPTTPK